MDAELQEIQNFIHQYPPFNELPDEVIEQITRQIEIAYYRKDAPIVHFGDFIKDFYIVRSGVVEIHRRNGELYNRLDEGDIFGQLALMTNSKMRFPAKAIEDTLVYCIPKAVFQQLYDKYDSFADFVEVDHHMRLRHTVSTTHDANDLTTSKVTTLINRPPVSIEKAATIQAAAQKMADEGVSALLIMNSEIDENDENDENHHQIAGIISERDLCTRVLAKGLSPLDKVANVMTTEVI